MFQWNSALFYQSFFCNLTLVYKKELAENIEFDTLWLAAGNSNTNHSNLTKSTSHESLIPWAEYRVYFTSIYVILRVKGWGTKRALWARNVNMFTRAQPFPKTLLQV